MHRALWIICVALFSSAAWSADVTAQRPCNSPEFRQFDFWIGDWDVTSAAAPGTTSRNRISLVNDGCTLREEYATPTGYAGTSLNFYDAARKRYRAAPSASTGSRHPTAAKPGPRSSTVATR